MLKQMRRKRWQKPSINCWKMKRCFGKCKRRQGPMHCSFHWKEWQKIIQRLTGNSSGKIANNKNRKQYNMKIVLFYHSLLSDWNHGNAHFLRGVATELIERGNEVFIYEPEGAWSLSNLIQEHGEAAIHEFYHYYPQLKSISYNTSTIDLDAVL